MARPTGWDILGLDGDPTPGVVDSVQTLAKQFGDFAHDVESAYRSLNSFGGDAAALQWVGQTADAFKSNFGPLPGRLQKLYTSYSEASDALSAYAPKLQAAQSKADSALRQALDAHADLQRATTAANTAATDLKTAQQNHAAVPNQQAVTDAQTAHDTAQNNLNNAKAHMAALTAQANQAHDDRIAAAQECARALRHAQSDGIHNKHWWEHLGADLAEWGGKIAEIANDLAPFLDVLALATSWIPGVDVITAGLAEADNLIALAGTGLEIVGDGMQGHWGDALMGAGMLGATFLGGKAISAIGGKAFGALAGKFGKEAEEGAADTVGAEARTAEGSRDSVCLTDPVDVVSGWMLTDETDLTLPGVLPVVLRRAYASGYQTGRLFGPGWSSTLDQRLSINEAGIHFAGDDAQRLDYPIPDANGETLPTRGDRWPLVWDREADEIRITDPRSGQTRHFDVVHHRDELGQIRDLTAISDRNGNRISILRDDCGTPTGIEHPGYRIAVDTVGTVTGPRVSAIRLLDGSERGVTVKEYRYDERGRLVGVVNSSGKPYVYEYNDSDRINAWMDRTGYRYTYEYDLLGRVVRTGGDGGFMAGTFAYHTQDRITVFTNSLGHSKTLQYDELGHVIAETDALGNTILFEYDERGRVLARTDPLGGRMSLDRDGDGNVVRHTSPDGAVTEFQRNGFGQISAVRAADGGVWRREYDPAGNLLAVSDPLGAIHTFAYGENGAPAAGVDPFGSAVTFETDAAGLPITATDPLGATTRVTRDPFGRVTELVDALGARSEMRWTVEGRRSWQIGPDGARSEWTFDAEGRLLTITDPTGARTVFEPGPFGRAVARTGPDGVRHGFVYDTELNLTAVIDPDGAEWHYRFDPVGRLISETDFIGRSLEYRYDTAGRLVARSTGAGSEIGMDRDAVGRLVARHTPDGTFSYAYDVAGQLAAAAGPGTSIEYRRDALGHVLAETVDGRTTTFAYDAMGRRIGRTTPAGAVSAWEYDAAGRPSSLQAGSGSIALAYDAVDRETERVLGPGAWLTNDFDESGRICAQRMFVGDRQGEERVGDPALTRSWQWRGDGILLQIDDSLRGTRRFEADAVGRITAVSADTWSESYAYDAFGNLTATDAGAEDTAGAREVERTLIRSAGRSTYERDETGRLVRTVRRTLDGRRKVWQYRWDAEDHLTQVVTPDGVTWQYTYDPLSRRTGKIRVSDDGAVVERVLFVWDGPRVAEQHSFGPDTAVTTLTWDYDPGTFRPAAQRRRSWAVNAPQEAVDEVFHAIVTDLVGTPTELVAPDGQIAWRTTSSLWGRSTATITDPDVDCPLRFPGQYYDSETGLHYNLHRYYDPDTAAYLTPDPLGLAAAPNDHAYVPNPLVFMDPLGLQCDQGQRVYQRAVDEADKAANALSSSQRPAVSEAIQVGTGAEARFYTSLSGQSQELAPEVQAVLDRVPVEERGVGHGRCGLPSCLTQAINDGVDPTGAKAAAVLIKNDPEKWDHGVPIGPCPSCAHLRDHFNLDFVE